MTEDNHYPYLVRVDGKWGGFVFVQRTITETKSYFSITEFFIMKKYRRTGIGKSVAKDIFRIHKGNWEVFQIAKNEPAQLFWRNVINDFTSGQFTEQIEESKKITQIFVS